MTSERPTFYLLFVVFSILMSAFQYGYHNGELNTPQSVITKCTDSSTTIQTHWSSFLPACIPMTDARYAIVVSSLTAGGLFGALAAPHFNDRYGRRLTLFYTNLLLALGSILTSCATSPSIMTLGRFLSGIGSGVVTVVVPAYIAECVPQSSRGLFGAMNQLAIVIGIMMAQVVGLFWSNLKQWRWILAIGFILAVIQAMLLPFCVESPKYLASLPGGLNQAKKSLLRLRQSSIDEIEEEIQVWKRGESDEIFSTSSTHITVWQFVTLPHYQRPLMIILLLQLAQQLSGINAVIFYSTSVMSTVFPESSGRITVYISVVNLIMTTLSAFLMDRVGRRTLFLMSSGLMALMALLLGWSMMNSPQMSFISALAILGFVAAFAIGLGPIPFLMIPELVEAKAVSSACSVGLAVNMVSNFIISAGFPSLRLVMGQGQVFYLFAGFLTLFVIIAFRILPETKGRSAEDVIRSGYERIRATAD
ncbi:general substrate transporter [Cokeromyces recurvatus]|uniref:general substrate transporter n=1 Tax=Cokeromyces recurvatus TaxID=90255 RepID=UPI002220743A|nr:general substrate transporter [Cokeromyces recurvatus]KAI7906347.1 general substrate transporter [Cokeromyces recurvatus]